MPERGVAGRGRRGGRWLAAMSAVRWPRAGGHGGGRGAGSPDGTASPVDAASPDGTASFDGAVAERWPPTLMRDAVAERRPPPRMRRRLIPTHPLRRSDSPYPHERRAGRVAAGRGLFRARSATGAGWEERSGRTSPCEDGCRARGCRRREACSGGGHGFGMADGWRPLDATEGSRERRETSPGADVRHAPGEPGSRRPAPGAPWDARRHRARRGPVLLVRRPGLCEVRPVWSSLGGRFPDVAGDATGTGRRRKHGRAPERVACLGGG